MKQKLGLTKSSVLFVSTLVTSLGIAATPSMAASLARSEAIFTIFNYSQNPENLPEFGDISEVIATELEPSASANGILTSTKVNTSVSGNIAIANALATATFLNNNSPLSNNTTFSEAAGDTNTYLGSAFSQATVAGEFNIAAGATFSFEFAANLAMSTAVENPLGEIANASGDLSLILFDSTNNVVLDYFTAFSKIATSAYPTDSADFFGYNNSQNINLIIADSDKSFGNSHQESVTASFFGSYQRSFQSNTRLVLIEAKTNQVTVKAPEPSNTFALLLGFGLTSAFVGAKSKFNGKIKVLSTQAEKV